METLQPHIKKVVARYVCNEADAADLCQELNLKLWLRPSKLLNAAVMDAYLTQAIRNLWLDYLRRRSRIAERLPTVALDDAQLLIGQSAPEAEQVGDAECRLLEDVWLKLDAREQRVVTESHGVARSAADQASCSIARPGPKASKASTFACSAVAAVGSGMRIKLVILSPSDVYLGRGWVRLGPRRQFATRITCLSRMFLPTGSSQLSTPFHDQG